MQWKGFHGCSGFLLEPSKPKKNLYCIFKCTEFQVDENRTFFQKDLNLWQKLKQDLSSAHDDLTHWSGLCLISQLSWHWAQRLIRNESPPSTKGTKNTVQTAVQLSNLFTAFVSQSGKTQTYPHSMHCQLRNLFRHLLHNKKANRVPQLCLL